MYDKRITPHPPQHQDSASAASAAAAELFVYDVLETMYRQESSIYQGLRTMTRRGNNNSSSSRGTNNAMLDSWRAMLIDWMYQVVDFSRVRRETIGAAVFFLDICIDHLILEKTDKRLYQLAAATSLQLAAKTHDCKIIKHKDLTILGRGMFTEDDVRNMEFQIIFACNWHLHPPSVYCFLNQYKELLYNISADTKAMIYEISMIISSMTMNQAKYKYYPPSITAYGTMLVAMAFIDPMNIPPSTRRFFCESISHLILYHNTTTDDDDDCNDNCNNNNNDLLITIIQEIQKSLEQRSTDLNCLGPSQLLLQLDSDSVNTMLSSLVEETTTTSSSSLSSVINKNYSYDECDEFPDSPRHVSEDIIL